VAGDAFMRCVVCKIDIGNAGVCDTCHRNIIEQNQMLMRNELIARLDFKECLETLMDVVNQACSVRDCEHSPYYLDSMALSSYADALRYLERHGMVEVTSSGGRRVIGKEKTNCTAVQCTSKKEGG